MRKVVAASTGVRILVTLCRFDHKVAGRPHLGPFIPCERRLGNTLFLEIQGRDFWTWFLI